MNISERAVRIAVSDVVAGFRHHFFNPADCPDIAVAYQEARSRLDGISLIFPDGRISRFIQAYQDELFQLGHLAGCDASPSFYFSLSSDFVGQGCNDAI